MKPAMIHGLTRRAFIAAVSLLWLPARSAPATGVKRLGILAHGGRLETVAEFEAHDRKPLAGRGWVEGKTLAIDWRFALGDETRFEALARELVEARVDVIATAGITRTRAILKATRAIPVFTVVGDPVAAGFAASLSRPGGNATGIALSLSEVAQKQVALLRAVMPRVSRILALSTTRAENMRIVFAPLLDAASKAGIAVEFRRVATRSEVEAALAAVVSRDRNAVFVGNLPAGLDDANMARLAIRHRVATLSNDEEFVVQGGLMSFILEHEEIGERSAAIIDKLLRGADPATTPFELPSRSRFVINRKTAAAIGVTFPLDFAIRADRAID